MQRLLYIVTLPVLISICISTGIAQQRVSGFVADALNGERLIGATISVPGRGVITDNNGYFVFSHSGSDTITISFTGYSPARLWLNNHRDTIIHVSLDPGRDLAEVQVSAPRLTRNNIARLTAVELQTIPSLTGKPDVMRAMQLLPGIMSQSEGSSLLLVRGGNPGENIYLFDNVPIIYVNHFGGFMSVFNPDIINSMDVYKGNFPARYGGKLSSVVNITQREGNKSGFEGSYHLGLTDLSLSLEGPIRDDMSIIFTGRKTLLDLFFLAASSLSEGNSASVFYGFHDINTKLSWKPDIRNSFHLNLFQGDDYFNFQSKKSKENPDNKSRMTYIWGNWMASGGWKHLASTRLFAETNISYTRYRNKENQTISFKTDTTTERQSFKHLSSVDQISLISNWHYQAAEGWNINFGINSNLAFLLPVYSELPNQPQRNFSSVSTIENALYVENRFKLPWETELVAGLRGVHFNNSSYTTLRPEPRVSLLKDFGSQHQLHLGYMQVNQFSHLLFTPGSLFSNEVWIPAEKNILPSRSNQYNIGWMGNFADGGYQSEVNLYYKDLTNLATYKEGFAHLRADENWRSKIESKGMGQAWGLEFMLRKNTGSFTGFASYAYSKANRTFPGINQGKMFPFEFDRPHSLSLSLSHHFSRRSSINATWVFQSGLPYTPVIARQLTPSLVYRDDDGLPFLYETFIYGDRNSARMKHYHRLDVSYNINRYNDDNKLRSSWTLGLYNAYNRKNPVFYYYNTQAGGGMTNPEWQDYDYKPFNKYQLALFPVIPAVSYRYYFGRRDISQRKTIKERFQKLLFHD